MPLLRLENVHTFYGESHILQGVDLRVERAEVVCLLGRNGAGKTTTLRSIIGLVAPREGRVFFDGRRISGEAPERIARRGMAIVPQAGGVFPTLTVKENLLFAARSKPGGWTLERVYSRLPHLRAREHYRGGQLSGGERQMVGIGRALMTNCEFLMLDEPSEGLSPLLVREIEDIIMELKQSGRSILLVEERMPTALRVANRIYVMNKGHIVAECTPAELSASETIKSEYLGMR